MINFALSLMAFNSELLWAMTSTKRIRDGGLDTFLAAQERLLIQARRKRGGWGGFSPPNNLLKFVDFETEKGCKSQRSQE